MTPRPRAPIACALGATPTARIAAKRAAKRTFGPNDTFSAYVPRLGKALFICVPPPPSTTCQFVTAVLYLARLWARASCAASTKATTPITIITGPAKHSIVAQQHTGAQWARAGTPRERLSRGRGAHAARRRVHLR